MCVYVRVCMCVCVFVFVCVCVCVCVCERVYQELWLVELLSAHQHIAPTPFIIRTKVYVGVSSVLTPSVFQ